MRCLWSWMNIGTIILDQDTEALTKCMNGESHYILNNERHDVEWILSIWYLTYQQALLKKRKEPWNMVSEKGKWVDIVYTAEGYQDGREETQEDILCFSRKPSQVPGWQTGSQWMKTIFKLGIFIWNENTWTMYAFYYWFWSKKSMSAIWVLLRWTRIRSSIMCFQTYISTFWLWLSVTCFSSFIAWSS